MNAEPIGARLKRLRLERGLSQRDLSEPGVSYAYISRIEAGARSPSVKALRKLARKLGVSVDYLETGRDVAESDNRELRLGDAELALRLGDDVAGAEQKLAEVLRDATAAGDRRAVVRARIALGLAAAQRGSQLEVVERLEEVASDEAAPPPHLRPDLYTTLGAAYAALGAPERAVTLFERCLEQVRDDVPEDAPTQIRYATFLSYALSDSGDHGRAGDIVRDALEHVDENIDAYTRVRLYWSLARLSMAEGRFADALEHNRNAIALLKVTDNTLMLARAHLVAAGVELRQANARAARQDLERAERLLGTAPERADLAMLRVGESRLAALENDAGRAVERARDALALLGEFHGGEQGFAVAALARGLALQDDDTGAHDAYRRAVDLLTVHGRRGDAAETSREWAAFLQERGRGEEAEPILRRAYDLGVQSETEANRTR